jgi:NitT/TauT family transport system ATP-binding protein
MELIAERVSHRYGGLAALEDIDLIVRPGEFLAIIGPSGCGKSTLLGILGGILKPSGGRVIVRGEPAPGVLNPFTYVFQDFALLPWRTVEGNILLALEHRRISRADKTRRLDDALARTGLAEFRGAFPKQLSGGMRQRVGIARALAVSPAVLGVEALMERRPRDLSGGERQRVAMGRALLSQPDLLLMDEPLSALDAQTRELLLEDFLALWLRERLSVAYVTHNLSEALRLADRIVVLSRRPGRVRRVIDVGITQSERQRPDAQAELAVLHDTIWGLIRDEAQVAERELIGAASDA